MANNRYGAGRGRGRGYFQPLEMWEARPGKTPQKTWIKPDPITGCYKLYVKSIPRTWSEVTLRNVFTKVGVPTSVYLNKGGDHPLTWGFIEYETYQEAREAVQKLNNNVALGSIEVSFAREKADDYIDLDESNFEFLEAPTTPVQHNFSVRNDKAVLVDAPTPDAKMYSKTIKNEQSLRSSIGVLNHCRKLPYDSQDITHIEHAIFSRVVYNYENAESSGNCEVCKKSSNHSCGDCSVNYCSKECQTKHWPTHSRTCVPLDDANENNNVDLRGSGDARPHGNGMTNGFGPSEFNRSSRSRENLYNDNRSEEKPSSFNRRNDDSDRHKSRFGDRQNSYFNDGQNSRGSHQRDRSRPNDRFGNRESGGSRNMYEERKSKVFSNKSNRSEPENDDSWNAATNEGNQIDSRKSFNTLNNTQPTFDRTIPRTVNQENHNKSSSDPLPPGVEFILNEQEYLSKSEPRTSAAPEIKPRGAQEQKIEPSPFSSSDLKVPSSLKSTETVSATSTELKTPSISSSSSEVNALSSPTSLELEAGVEEEVTVGEIESPGHFYVQLKRQEELCHGLNRDLNLPNADYAAFTPVERGICVAKYEGVWCRCKVTRLEPLTVHYIDYGNSETLTADRLFTLPEQLASVAPFAIKIKLSPGTPTELLNKELYSTFSIKPVNKVGDCWLVEIPGVVYPKPPPAEPSLPTPQPRQQPTPAAVPVFSKLLPADVFTEVAVRVKSPNFLAVTPVASLPELEKFSARLQTEAEKAKPLLPAITKCLALDPVTNLWGRGRIMQLDPLYVKFVDHGTAHVCDADKLRELSSELTTVPPFVVFIKPKNGTVEELSQNTTFSVTPLYKDKDNSWVVDVAVKASPEAREEITTERKISDSHPEPIQVAQQTPPPTKGFPEFLKQDQFTTGIIAVAAAEDTYFVGGQTFLYTVKEMDTYFQSATRGILESPKIGDIGLAFYENMWYRVKVVSQTPLLVSYIDFGNIEEVKEDELKICPDSHKQVPPLVSKVKLASGTDKKYKNRAEYSEISIKPVSMLPDGTILVQVEGESYSEPATEQMPEVVATPAHTTPVPTQVVEPLQHASIEQNIVDLLKQGYDEVKFIPNTLDIVKNIVFGTVFHKQFPKTVHMATTDDFDSLSKVEPDDPAFMPGEGELVASYNAVEWQRAKVLKLEEELWLSWVDHGSIVKKNHQCKRLLQHFSSVPFMGAVLELSSPVDMNLLNKISEELELNLVVEAKGPTGCEVQWQMDGKLLKGKLEKWNYEPLAWPRPLSSGALVNICKVLTTSTYVVNPANDIHAQQFIQIECGRPTCVGFEVPPKTGDYAVFTTDDEAIFHRGRIQKIDDSNKKCSLLNIDLGHECKDVDIATLKQMPSALCKLPCRATKIALTGVEDVDFTELATVYISTLAQNETPLRIEYNEEIGSVTLTVDGSKECVNTKLKELLAPKIEPDENGKFTYRSSLTETNPPMKKEVSLIVTQSYPLYVHLADQAGKFYNDFHPRVQVYANSESALYNPCENEVCIVKHVDNDWYRALCVRETNTGYNSVMLLDFGNIINVETKNIRKIIKELLEYPIAAVPCKVVGFPSEVTPEFQQRLTEILPVDSLHQGTFESEQDGQFIVSMPNILKTLQEKGLVP